MGHWTDVRRRWRQVGLGLSLAAAASVLSSPAAAAVPVDSFADVPVGAYYATGASWLASEGITTGYGGDPTIFAPDAVVTRAQMAAFLWRLHDRPDAPAGGFGDAPVTAYWRAGAEWLRQLEVTTGFGGDLTTFAPDVAVSRAQMAAFLWRLAGRPTSTGPGFDDVPPDAYYATAARWLAERGVTTGYGGDPARFAPDVPVSRAQMAAFLYRLDRATTRSLDVLTGTGAAVEVPVPVLRRVDEVVPGPESPGLRVAAVPASLGAPAVAGAGVTVTASLDASGDHRVPVRVTGCTLQVSPCPAAATATVRVVVAVHVSPPGPTSPDGFPAVDADRWLPRGDGTYALPGEVTILTADGVAAGDVASLVQGLGGGLTGADPDLGLYRARFPDAAAASAALRASTLVHDATPAVGEPIATNSLRVADWSGRGSDQTWTFQQTRAPEAWERYTTGSADVHLGIVDVGIHADHSDLGPLSSYEHPYVGSSFELWRRNPFAHGTHVAGTMCLRDGNGGLVGVSQRCALDALDLGGAPMDAQGVERRGLGSIEVYQERASRLVHWLRRHPDVRVVNISLTLAGTHPAVNGCRSSVSAEQRDWFRKVLTNRITARVLFVVAGGNCGGATAPGRYRNAADAIPQALHDLPNVIAVGATGRRPFGASSSSFAPYSARDVDLAAPGGTDADPVWSTVFDSCSAQTRTCRPSWSAHTFAGDAFAGTSMASPHVAGAAGLMLAMRPGLQPADLKRCLVAGATTPIAGTTVRELVVPDALRCATDDLEFTSAAPAPVEYGGVVDLQLEATGGVAPYTFGLSSPLPTDWPEVSIQAGRLRGRLGSVDTTLEFAVTDAVGHVTRRSYTFGPAVGTATFTPDRTSGPSGIRFIARGTCPVGRVPADATTRWVLVHARRSDPIGSSDRIVGFDAFSTNPTTGSFAFEMSFLESQGSVGLTVECLYQTSQGGPGTSFGRSAELTYLVTAPTGTLDVVGGAVRGASVVVRGRCEVPATSVTLRPFGYDEERYPWPSDWLSTSNRITVPVAPDGSFGPVDVAVPVVDARFAEFRLAGWCNGTSPGVVVDLPTRSVGTFVDP